jgi:eukaryotic-like serine/threonine-protein kinase
MSFQLGQIIGDYEFVDVLRSSKNNVAYKVKNVLAQRFETLKIVPGDLHHDPERLERFQREIKIHARLDHPNILTFYNASVLNGHLVMTTAFVEGTTLEERLELGPLPWRQSVEYGAQIAAALAAAHGQGIVHRELTPANIMLTSDDRAIISGFGQAKAAHDPRLTQKGAVVGSLFYMSPEQVRGDEHVDARSDLYSLGAVLFEMTTGQRLFTGKSHFDIMVAHVNQAPPIPSSLVADLPTNVSDTILRCVAKIPGQRFSTADELRTSLRALGAATSVSPAAAPPERQEAVAVPNLSAETPSGTAARLLDLAHQDSVRPSAAPAERKPAPVAAPPAPEPAVSAEGRRSQTPSPTSPAQIPAEMGAELASGDRKALVVLVCTLFFLLISTLILSKLG